MASSNSSSPGGSDSSCLRIRLHASNLPRQGRLIKSLPDTFAVVTSVAPASPSSSPTSDNNRNTDSTDIHSYSNSYERNSLKSSPPQGVIWGRTETIFKSSHPQWTECIFLEPPTAGHPEKERFFYVHIFQHEPEKDESSLSNSSSSLLLSKLRPKPLSLSDRSISQSKLDFSKSLGSALFEVSNVLGGPQHSRVKRLRNGGCVFCRLEVVEPHVLDSLARRFAWQFAVRDLLLCHEKPKPSTLSQTSAARGFTRRRRRRRPIYALVELSKLCTAGKQSMWIVTFRSPLIQSQSDGSTVVWDEHQVDLGTLCHGDDVSEPILITVKAISSSSLARDAHKLKTVGVTETTLQQLLHMGTHNTAIMNYDSSECQDQRPPPSPVTSRRLARLTLAITGVRPAVNGEHPVGQQDQPQHPADESFSYTDNSSASEDENGDTSNHKADQTDPNASFNSYDHPMGIDDVPLQANEMFLQRNQGKLKRVGRLQVLKAELLSAGEGDEDEDGGNYASSNPLYLPSTLEQSEELRREAASKLQDYLDQGLDIDFSVAIDFTSSNGNPLLEGTLHYQDPNGGMNDYEEAILAIGQAMDAYTKSKDYNVWGFGAKFGGITRHMFQVGPSAGVQGVNGVLSVLSAYRSMFASDLILSGPTIWTEVLQKVARQAKAYQSDSQLRYSVLLILTDGVPDALNETQRKLAVYSQVPMSVIIVGVGASPSFSRLQCLTTPTTATGGGRPNVSLVEFRQHQHSSSSLAAAALQDLPEHICDYMRRRGLNPDHTCR